MNAKSVEWSFGKSPRGLVEAWSVAATVEVILAVLVEDNKEKVASFFAKRRN